MVFLQELSTKVIVILYLCLLLFCAPNFAGTFLLTWDPPQYVPDAATLAMMRSQEPLAYVPIMADEIPTTPPPMLNGPWTVRNVKGGVFGLIHHPVYCVGPHEVYQHCDAHCDQMCDGSNKMGLSCDYRICLAGCNCKPGYARNDQDKCIRITECKRPPIKEKSRKKKKLHKKPKPNRVERLA